jgi:hypothetical protein
MDMTPERYWLKETEVTAWRLSEGAKAVKRAEGKPAEWAVMQNDGLILYLLDKEFRKKYQKVEPRVVYKEKTAAESRAEWGIYG